MHALVYRVLRVVQAWVFEKWTSLQIASQTEKTQVMGAALGSERSERQPWLYPNVGIKRLKTSFKAFFRSLCGFAISCAFKRAVRPFNRFVHFVLFDEQGLAFRFAPLHRFTSDFLRNSKLNRPPCTFFKSLKNVVFTFTIDLKFVIL